MTIRRLVACELWDGAPPIGELPPVDTEARKPWLSSWEFERAGKRWRAVVFATVVCPPIPPPDWTGPEHDVTTTIDARTWIETVGDLARWPEGTRFELVVEEVTIAPAEGLS